MKILKVIKYFFMSARFKFFNRMQFVLDISASKPIVLSPTKYRSKPEDCEKVHIFASCDSEYFIKYANSFVSSFSKNSNRHPIHIHICNPTTPVLVLAEKLEHMYPDFSSSYDDTNLARLRNEDRAIYYCSVRFVRMFDFCKTMQKPCLCLDIDVFCNQKTDGLMERLDDSDVAFYARFHKIGNSTKLLAGTLFVANSAPGFSFLTDVKNKLFYMIEHGFFVDKLDQVVIYDCFQKLKKSDINFKFNDLRDFFDTEFTDEGVIWYPKGSTKRDSKFLEYLQRIENQSLTSSRDTLK